jgi:hypothetical protein
MRLGIQHGNHVSSTDHLKATTLRPLDIRPLHRERAGRGLSGQRGDAATAFPLPPSDNLQNTSLGLTPWCHNEVFMNTLSFRACASVTRRDRRVRPGRVQRTRPVAGKRRVGAGAPVGDLDHAVTCHHFHLVAILQHDELGSRTPPKCCHVQGGYNNPRGRWARGTGESDVHA